MSEGKDMSWPSFWAIMAVLGFVAISAIVGVIYASAWHEQKENPPQQIQSE
jgi:hypothetical protein